MNNLNLGIIHMNSKANDSKVMCISIENYSHWQQGWYEQYQNSNQL